MSQNRKVKKKNEESRKQKKVREKRNEKIKSMRELA